MTIRLAGIALVLAGVTACADVTEPAAGASVSYTLDAPFCSFILPVRFSIDGTVVGTDSFRIHLAPDHVTSAAFRAAAGTHTVGAQVIGGYVWPDTVVTLAPGAAFTRILPFYCS